MNIDINIRRVNRQMQHSKRITVLHGIRCIRLLDGTVYDIAANVSPINKVIHKITISTGNYRLSQKSVHLAEYFLAVQFH